MHPYKYILFDFDGTIADSRQVFIDLYNELALKHGYAPMTAGNLETLRGLSIPERCRALGIPPYRLPFLAAAVIKKYRASVPLLSFSPGMKELLMALGGQNIPFAVLSSNSEKNIAAFFGLNGIAVPDIFSSRSIFGKHVLLGKFLKAKKLTPSRVLYVGDELRDIQACRKAGVPVAWVSWGYDSYAAIQNNAPDHVLHSPAELLSVVEAS